jgi:hypothetical protein
MGRDVGPLAHGSGEKSRVEMNTELFNAATPDSDLTGVTNEP